MLVVANQTEGLLDSFGLTREEVDRSVWTVDSAGRRWEGAAAINRVLAEIGGPWSLVASLARVPVMAAVEATIYRAVARNRSRLAIFGVTPECDKDSHRTQP